MIESDTVFMMYFEYDTYKQVLWKNQNLENMPDFNGEYIK